MKNLYDEMHNLFSLSKTLRFELKPVGRTEEYFRKFILDNDERKAEAYPDVKRYCDEVHKNFIEECLQNIDSSLLENDLKTYYALLSQSEINNDEVDKVKNSLRKTISAIFNKHNMYKEILGEKILTLYVKDLYKDDEEALKKINEFNKFTTYFVGYHQTRANLYSAEEKHSAIAYRLIDENLSTFKNNLKLYEKFSEVCPEKIEQIKSQLSIDPNSLYCDITQYSKCLSQKDIEQYNLIISGKALENGQKIQGINEYINLYNQQNKDKTKLTKLKVLYKQLLSDKDSSSFVLDIIDNDKQVIDSVRAIYNNIEEVVSSGDFQSRFKNVTNYDLGKIYINSDDITTFSKLVFGDWEYIPKLREKCFDKNYVGNKKPGTDQYNELRDKELKKEKVISLRQIEDLAEEKGKIAEYFSKEIDCVIEKVQTSYNECQNVLNAEYSITEKTLQSNQNAVDQIKALLDNLKELQNFVRIVIPKTETERDLNFYNSLNYESLLNIIPVYNKIRNYLTKKPYSEEKIKLNFDCPTLLGGWDLNKEESNLSVLFEKNGLYYLGIMNKQNNRIFREIKSDGTDNYRKIEYKLLPGPNKMLPKVFFSNSRIEEFAPSNELLEKYNKGLHKKEANDIGFCHELIDFFKQSINKHEDWKNFNFKFSDTQKYEDISQFYREVTEQGYKITFKDISSKDIDELVDSGKLYLFQIYNKDFSQHSKGKENLHTMYWKALFDENNLSNVVYKLNGEAEVFFRKKSLTKNITVHKANEVIENKNPLNEKKESVFDYDIIKDKRYTLDKFMFHVPITLNFKAHGMNKFNDFVNEKIRYFENVNIIGIDRGERHLLYVTVIDSSGKIIDKQQFSLNEIVNEYNGKTHKVNYHDLLAKKEEERDKQRKSWSTIANIKELKEGYMSQVVHKITELMFKYNAVVVLEDLNSGFKNSRKKVEKSVYDKFEKMLVSKLEYLVNKDVKDKFEQGGVLNAYQLAKSDISGRQNGTIFYIPAWCTSKIDPTTGFINFFNVKYENSAKAREFFKKFDDIKYNETEKYYEFVVSDYSKFTDKNLGYEEEKNGQFAPLVTE